MEILAQEERLGAGEMPGGEEGPACAEDPFPSLGPGREGSGTQLWVGGGGEGRQEE